MSENLVPPNPRPLSLLIGKRVKVARGRKYPKGITGHIIDFVHDAFRLRAFMKACVRPEEEQPVVDPFWIDIDNLDLIRELDGDNGEAI